MGQDHHVVVGCGREGACDAFCVLDPQPRGGEALARRPLGTRVDDRDLEAAAGCDRSQRLRNVAGAEDVEPRGGQERLEEDGHLSPAAHAELLREVAGEHLVPAAREKSPGVRDHIVLDRAAADRADRLAVGRDQHVGCGLARREAAGADHGCEHERPARRAPARERVPHVRVTRAPGRIGRVGAGRSLRTSRAISHVIASTNPSRTALRTNTGTISRR